MNDSWRSIPDNSFLGKVFQHQASEAEVRAYLDELNHFLATNNPNTSQWYHIALDHAAEIKIYLENYHFEQAPPPKESIEIKRDRLNRSYYDKSPGDLEREIIAAATDKKSKLALIKVAAANSIPLDRVEAIADRLLQKQGLSEQHDLQKAEYEQCIAEIREIELKEDPGEKEWKLQKLARSYQLNKKEMLNVYYQSVLAHHIEDPMSLDEYRRTSPPNVEWLLRGWIPEAALILLHGHGGLGKTLFVHHLIKHVVRGVDWGEYKADTGRKGVLYIQTDTPLKIADEALKQAGLVEDNLPIALHGSWKVEYMSYLYRWIEKQRPALVIIDSLTSINRSNTNSENDTAYAQPIHLMREIAAEFGCSFFIIHHSNGAGEVRGTKAIRGAVDAVWRLEAASKDESNPERVLVMEKFRGRACGRYQLKFDDENFDWDLLEPEDQNGNRVQNTGTRRRIVDHLSRHRGVKFCGEDLAEALGSSSDTVRRELGSLVREGAIDRIINPEHNNRTKGQPKWYYWLAL